MPVKDSLTPEQIQMLQLSDDAIKNGRLVTREDLDKQDIEFLKLILIKERRNSL